MSGTQAASEPPDERAAPIVARPRPSPVWYGALMSGSLLLAALWLLSYTVLDWDWQQSLGGWNYAIAALFAAAQGQLMQHWNGHSRR